MELATLELRCLVGFLQLPLESWSGAMPNTPLVGEGLSLSSSSFGENMVVYVVQAAGA
jgi:hypothetical protein